MYGSCKSFCWVSSDVIDPSTCKNQTFWPRRPIENQIDLFFWKMVVLFLELLHWFLGKLLFNCSWFVFTLSNCVWIAEVGSNFDQSLIVIVYSYNLVIVTSTTRFNHSVDIMLFIFIPNDNRWLHIASDLACSKLLYKALLVSWIPALEGNDCKVSDWLFLNVAFSWSEFLSEIQHQINGWPCNEELSVPTVVPNPFLIGK